jgi:hypothetical protein
MKTHTHTWRYSCIMLLFVKPVTASTYVRVFLCAMAGDLMKMICFEFKLQKKFGS